jgi:DNA-binding response OmpR family regulator
MKLMIIHFPQDTEHTIFMLYMDKKIIVINNIDAGSSIPGVLTSNGYQVDVAYNAVSGLHRMETYDYGLAILLDSPYAESWHHCEQIRSFSGIPLIIISANASAESCVKAIAAGADYFIRKPFGPQELLARVGSLFQRVVYRQNVTAVS